MKLPEHPGANAAPESTSLDAVATALIDAYRGRSFVEAPSRIVRDFAKEDALEIAETVRRLRIAQGDTPVGYKVGFTNGAVRAQFGAEAQLAAPVYRETLSSEPRIDAGSLMGPRIEPESSSASDARGNPLGPRSDSRSCRATWPTGISLISTRSQISVCTPHSSSAKRAR